MTKHVQATFVEAYPSKFGDIAFQFNSDGVLLAISLFTDPTPVSTAGVKRPQGAPAKAEVRQWLTSFLNGKEAKWPGDWQMPGDTPFFSKVYEAVYKIPVGQTLSYGEVAQKCGSPGASRAVGTAMRKNPMPLLVPCHRVLAANGLGGFAGGVEGACELKRQLLMIEGHQGL